MVPLIFGIYRNIFSDAENVTVDHTVVHIRRTLKLTLLSVYSVCFMYYLGGGDPRLSPDKGLLSGILDNFHQPPPPRVRFGTNL